jgi:hypothetical protein
MKLLACSITSVIRTNFRIRLVLLFVSFILFTGKAYTQNNCPIGSADTEIKCPTENEYETMGIPTLGGSTYTWYKNGVRLAGPLPGDGQPTSFGFALRTSSDAGHYTVEENLPNGTHICRFNQLVQITTLPLAQTLTGGGPLCPGPIRTLTIAATQPNVTYGLYKDGGLWESKHSTGTGPLSFDIYNPGLYIVQADKDSCPGVYRFFGNVFITLVPDRPTINFTTINSANISWSGSGNFIVEYGLTGFTPGSGAAAGVGGTIKNASSSPVTINSGLVSGNRYDVYIRQLCQGGSYVTSEAAHFLTDCAPVTTFPYVEGFEGTTNAIPLPPCWNDIDNDNDGSPGWYTSTFQPRTGLRTLYGQLGDYLILPRMTLSGTKRLKFWVKSELNPEPCIVRLSTTDNSPNSFSNLLLNDTLKTQVFEEKIIDLSAFSGNVYIALSAGLVLKFDDFTIENKPPCPGPAFVKVTGAANNAATIQWAGTGTFIAEYGLANFIPGTGATAGTGGTVISNATSPLTIPSLVPGIAYDVYIRQNCTGSGNGFSANSPKTNFTTFLACSPTTISACTNVVVSMPSNTGVANFWGLYPINSTGKATPGKELLYSFTPASTGVYYLDVTDASNELSYFYKPVSAGCGNSGWTGIANIHSIGTFPVGLLQSGTPYYILIDNPFTTATTQIFKICKATVTAPSFTDVCISSITTTNVVAKSPKPEYLIDNNGHLIAALDFSNVLTGFANVAAYFWVNGGTVRHDSTKREYLDRNFTMATDAGVTGTIGVTLYFTNAELQRLIDEPNDGVADVGSITDLKVTKEDQTISCSGYFGSATSLITPSGNGSYDATSKYIQFNTTGFASFYLNGGSEPIFNTTILCPGDNTSMSMTPPGDGYIYQWQVDMGSGFANIIPSDYYNGINTSILNFRSPPTSFYGYKYRCIATGATSLTSDYKILKFAKTWMGIETTVWEDPRNWSCHDFGKQALPDANVDVIIPNVANKPVINSNVSCRSVTIQTGAMLTITPGFKLDITGH